jgi:hypothetical protein
LPEDEQGVNLYYFSEGGDIVAEYFGYLKMDRLLVLALIMMGVPTR